MAKDGARRTARRTAGRPAARPASVASLLPVLERLGRERGIVWTGPRRAVLRAVIGLRTHPTADEVRLAAERLRPGLGRATVYRALEDFVRAGILTRAGHAGSAVRYDPRPERHHHLVCLSCNRVEDVFDERFDALDLPDTTASGFVATDVQVLVRGLCRECRKQAASKVPSRKEGRS